MDRPNLGIDTMLEDIIRGRGQYSLVDSVGGTLFSDEFCPGDYSRGVDTTHSDAETLAHASRLNYGARPVTRAARSAVELMDGRGIVRAGRVNKG